MTAAKIKEYAASFLVIAKGQGKYSDKTHKTTLDIFKNKGIGENLARIVFNYPIEDNPENYLDIALMLILNSNVLDKETQAEAITHHNHIIDSGIPSYVQETSPILIQVMEV